MKYADHVRARLIAVGSSGKSPLRSFFMGSVGRGILIGAYQSILIARGGSAERGPVRAVLATDHSPYANRCIEALLRLAPRGISHLTVVTVFPKDKMEALLPFLPDFVLDPAEWVEQGLERRNREVIEKLKPLGCDAASRVEDGEVHDSLRKVMKDARADLLIPGAQGHGFVERVTLGSVSFHEAMSEPHSVLVLRAAEEPASPAGEV
jgi:nucleotide-binding universal stress UspA family protein